MRNYPIVALARQREHTSTLPLRLVYAGGLTKIRGIKEIILAIEPFAGEVQLVLLGKWASKEYEQECKTLHGWQYVQYEGQVDPQDVYSYYITCDIGMALLYPEPNYLHSLPVKAFEYLACGLPIIMSDFPYWQTHFSAGAIFVNPMQPADISASISELKNNLHQRITLGRQGKAMVLAQFSWEAESQTLIKTYTQLLGENRKN